MFIGLCGGKIPAKFMTRLLTEIRVGICTGKNSIAEYLVWRHGFSRLSLAPKYSLPDGSLSPIDDTVHRTDALEFHHVDSLLDFVTKHWDKRWVTTDIWDEQVLETLMRRPFFLLVSVDAPVSLRWKRLEER